MTSPLTEILALVEKNNNLPADSLETKPCSAILLNYFKKLLILFLMIDLTALHTPNCCPKPQVL